MGKHVLAKLSILLIALLLVMVGCSKENAEEKDNENKVVDKTPGKKLEEEEESEEYGPVHHLAHLLHHIVEEGKAVKP